MPEIRDLNNIAQALELGLFILIILILAIFLTYNSIMNAIHANLYVGDSENLNTDCFSKKLSFLLQFE